MARLPGKRLVSASETGEASALDEARLKSLSGEDTITARYLYKEFQDFKPVCKLWLSCNHRPQVKDDTFAFWRRVRCIDFPRQFSGNDIDPNLKAELAAEAEGILAWAVRWAGRYLALPGAIPVPANVAMKTDEYRSESDPLSEFIAEQCVIGAGCATTFAQIHGEYRDWADNRGLSKDERMTTTTLGKKLGDRFHKTRVKGKGPIAYEGIGLRSYPETRERGSK